MKIDDDACFCDRQKEIDFLNDMLREAQSERDHWMHSWQVAQTSIDRLEAMGDPHERY